MDRALNLAQPGDREEQIAIHLTYARTYDLQGQHVHALHHARLAERIAQNSTDLRYRAGVLTAIAKQLAGLGRSATALPLCQEGRSLYAQVNNRDGEAQALNTLGLIHQNLGNQPEAITCYEQALHLNRRIGSRYWEAVMLDRLADLYHAHGQPIQARDARHNALTILKNLHHPDAATVQAKLATA
ncbi:MAG: tetratricopeptide repeat protein [Labedaea sp.]